jgi:hypothetical protein
MKKSLFYLLLVAMSISTVTAQIKGGAVFFKTGYLNARGSSTILGKINPEGATDFTNHYTLTGIEAYYRSGKFIITWEGYSAQQTYYSLGANYCIEPFIGITQFKLGRVIKENKQSWLYPSVGIGTSAFFLYPYGQVNEKGSNLQKLTLVTPSIDVGINEDIFLTRINPAEKKYGGMLLALRAGYRFSFASNAWRDNNWNKVYNMPSYFNNGFYLTVGIGGGSFTKN